MNYIAMICGHNSGRSQMAQAAFNYFKKLFPSVDAKYEAISWGTGIKENGTVNPRVIETMKEMGIDLTDKGVYFPKTIDHPDIRKKLKEVVKSFTMGCMDKKCELPLGMRVKTKEIVDWGLEDPAEDETDVIAVRDKIIGKVLELINELNS